MDEKGISEQQKKSNVNSAYKASVALNLINRKENKSVAFIKGDRKAIDSLLHNIDLKYNLEQLSAIAGNIEPLTTSSYRNDN